MSKGHCAWRDRIQPRSPRGRTATLGLLLALLLAGAVAIPTLPATADDAACAAAESVTLNATFRRQYETPRTEPDFLRLPDLTPGFLALDVSTPIAAQAQPRLAFLGTGCAPPPEGEDAAYGRVRETPLGLVVWIRQAGDFFLAVSPEDPEVPLPGYRLHATFAPDPVAPDEVIALTANPPASCTDAGVPSFTPEPFAESRFVVVERPSDLMKEVDPWDDDILTGNSTEPGVLLFEAEGTPLRTSLHGGGDCSPAGRLAEGWLDGAGAFVAAVVHGGEHRLVLEPQSTFDVRYDLLVKHFALCLADGADDRPLCATPLAVGEVKAGVIGNGAGDDEDYYTFTLALQETIAVELVGEDGIRAVLYDEDGQRLASWPGGRLVRTLGPERYYVRVGSVEPWGGNYALRVEAVPVP